jgi:hypothetical protein
MRVCQTAIASLAARKEALRPVADELAARSRQLDLTLEQTLAVVKAAVREAPHSSQADRGQGGS